MNPRRFPNLIIVAQAWHTSVDFVSPRRSKSPNERGSANLSSFATGASVSGHCISTFHRPSLAMLPTEHMYTIVISPRSGAPLLGFMTSLTTGYKLAFSFVVPRVAFPVCSCCFGKEVVVPPLRVNRMTRSILIRFAPSTRRFTK